MAKRKSGARPENSRVGEIYLIRHIGTDAHKIGITLDWYRRAEQLDVGLKSEEVAVAKVLFPGRLEKQLHRRYDKHRLPQSEWFHLSAEQVREVVDVFASESVKYKLSIEHQKVEQAPRQANPYRIVNKKAEAEALVPIRNESTNLNVNRSPLSSPAGKVPTLAPPSWKFRWSIGFLSCLFLPIWGILASAAPSDPKTILLFIGLQAWIVASIAKGK